MSSHKKAHGLASTEDHEPGTNDTVAATVSGAVVEKAFGQTAVANNLVERKGDAQITVPLTPLDATDSASKGFVISTALSGTSWKELILHQNQLLNGGTGAVLQALLATIAVNLAAGDTFILTDGTVTETFTAVGAAPGAFEFLVGGSAAATQTNLVAAINADSTLWSAVESTGLDDYFAAAPAGQFVVYRTASSANADRVFGTIASAQSDIKVIEFATGQQDYQDVNGIESDLPSSDPAAKRFGFGRTFADLTQNETHRIAEDNNAFTWDADDNNWQNVDTNSAPLEGDGIDVTANKVSTDVATATVARKFGAIGNRTLSDGSAEGAAADAGFLSWRSDDVDLAVSSANEAVIKPDSRLDRYKGNQTWNDSSNDEPTLTELNTGLGTVSGDIGNKAMFVGATNNKTFWVIKNANAGALTDYFGVELEDFA